MYTFDDYSGISQKIIDEIRRKKDLIRALKYEEDPNEILYFIDEIGRIENRIKELEKKNDEIAKHIVGYVVD